jgi:hypothetical protein
VDFPPRSTRALGVTVTLALATALAGCSSSSWELRTPAQAAGFVSEVASGEPYGDWRLAGDATQQADQAWAARATVAELGRNLRSGPYVSIPGGASWSCEMARNLVSLGAVAAVTSFNSDDVGIVTRKAQALGVDNRRIWAMIHDASTVPFRDLAIATAVVCGPMVS